MSALSTCWIILTVSTCVMCYLQFEVVFYDMVGTSLSYWDGGFLLPSIKGVQCGPSAFRQGIHSSIQKHTFVTLIGEWKILMQPHCTKNVRLSFQTGAKQEWLRNFSQSQKIHEHLLYETSLIWKSEKAQKNKLLGKIFRDL